jgi:hypothetical protein
LIERIEGESEGESEAEGGARPTRSTLDRLRGGAQGEREGESAGGEAIEGCWRLVQYELQYSVVAVVEAGAVAVVGSVSDPTEK